jgi:predicted Zn-dependent protease with MMP-like domain
MPLRRRGTQHQRMHHRRVALPEPEHLAFEDLVARALESLPETAQRLLRDVAIVIEDEPSVEQRLANGLELGETLYGLYEGTPAVVYGSDWIALPNKISLFRLPLEEDFADPDELAAEVRRTVIHELAHHAGLDESMLERYGWE